MLPTMASVGQRTQSRSVSPHAALRAGIGHGASGIAPFLNLSVAENVFMGHEPVSSFIGWVRKEQLHSQTARILARLGAAIPYTRPIEPTLRGREAGR